VAIQPTSESAPAHAAVIDGGQTLIVELREGGDPEPVDWVRQADDWEVERDTVSAGRGRKGKRAPAHAAVIDGDQTLIVELREGGDPEPVDWVREADDWEVERDTVSAGRGRKGKRAEYRCAACSYGIVVSEQPPSCPICSEARWEHVERRPLSSALLFLDAA
jgi:hypothetical protein